MEEISAPYTGVQWLHKNSRIIFSEERRKRKKSTLERDLQSSSSPSRIPGWMFCAEGPRAASSLKPC